MAATVGVQGIGDAKRALDRLYRDAPDMALRAVRAGAARLGDEMEARAPELSGAAGDAKYENSIKRSIHMRKDGPTSVLVGTTHGLAGIFEDGGEITPTTSEMLRFTGDSGEEVFTERVIIPAQPFMRPAVDEARGAAFAQVKRSASRALDGFTTGLR